MYGISGYPTKFIIDPEGKINKRVIGEDPEFYTYLVLTHEIIRII